MRDILPPTPFYLLPFSGSLKKKAFEDTFFFGGGGGEKVGWEEGKERKKNYQTGKVNSDGGS